LEQRAGLGNKTQKTYQILPERPGYAADGAADKAEQEGVKNSFVPLKITEG
jgi:hypothetical protein